MKKEWIDPRYAELVAAWRRAQRSTGNNSHQRPIKGFIVPRM
ncbi:hypothetical protein ACIQ9E_16140 [Streptomyces sp. NPDC094448]